MDVAVVITITTTHVNANPYPKRKFTKICWSEIQDIIKEKE